MHRIWVVFLKTRLSKFSLYNFLGNLNTYLRIMLTNTSSRLHLKTPHTPYHSQVTLGSDAIEPIIF
jgi:hypothetical protein